MTGTSSITISLTDINDQTPQFTEANYSFNVSESALPNSYVGQVNTTDGDTGANARVQYAIVSGHDGKFYIDRILGEIEKKT